MVATSFGTSILRISVQMPFDHEQGGVGYLRGYNANDFPLRLFLNDPDFRRLVLAA